MPSKDRTSSLSPHESTVRLAALGWAVLGRAALGRAWLRQPWLGRAGLCLGALGLTALLPACESASSNDAAADSPDDTTDGTADPTRFRITLENVSAPLDTPAGPQSVGYAPGLWLVHEGGQPLFELDRADRGEGLEQLAEDGNASVLFDAMSLRKQEDETLLLLSRFRLPDSEYEAGVLRPGAAYVIEFEARPGALLSFAGMYAQSNDVFFGTPPGGLPLFDAEDAPLLGDRTAELALYDTGTEVDEAPGEGENQAPRQSAPGQGAAEGGVVHRIAEGTEDGFDYPLPFVTATLEVLP